ncbi:MAG: copper transporter, partial [Rhodoglobus sp.]|nr:copper transporter [Rhodoglobus sp.]
MVPRLVRIAGPALLLLVALATMIAALQLGGGATAPLLLAPGPVVRYGLPVAKLFVNLGISGTVGSLVVVCFALDGRRPGFALALDVAAASAAVWTVAAAATGFLSFVTAYSQPVSLDNSFGNVLAAFLTGTDLGRAWLWSVLIAAAVTVLCFAVRNLTALF